MADRLVTAEALATALLGSAIAPPRLALTREEAARSLGVSLDSFERWIQPDLRLIRRGRLRLVPVSELEAWIAESAQRTLDGPCAT
jgi:excisionase family DNA binding protein